MCPADSRGEELDLIVITKKRKEYHVETFFGRCARLRWAF